MSEIIDTGYQVPRDPVEIWLACQWQRVLGFAVGIRENFFGVGGNSLDAARVIDAILVKFGVQLPLNALTAHPTVERLATVLRGHAGQLSGPLITISDGDRTRPPLFLIHPDNGQASPYCQLAYALGEDYAVLALQAPGLYSDTEPRSTVQEMAGAYLDAIRAVRPAGPYLLGGADVGAAIAYEMAARLGDVRLLAMIDTILLEPPGTGTDPAPQDAAPEFVARSLRVRQANREAMRDWRPSPYTGPVDVFSVPANTILPATAVLPANTVQRTHECGTDGDLAGALGELIG